MSSSTRFDASSVPGRSARGWRQARSAPERAAGALVHGLDHRPHARQLGRGGLRFPASFFSSSGGFGGVRRFFWSPSSTMSAPAQSAACRCPPGRGRQREHEERPHGEHERLLPPHEALLDHLDAGPVPEQLVRPAERDSSESGEALHNLGLGHLSPFFQGLLDRLLVLGALLREHVVGLLLEARHLGERAPGPDHREPGKRARGSARSAAARRRRDGPRGHAERLPHDGLGARKSAAWCRSDPPSRARGSRRSARRGARARTWRSRRARRAAPWRRGSSAARATSAPGSLRRRAQRRRAPRPIADVQKGNHRPSARPRPEHP